MEIVTAYFSVLPILLFISIRFAVAKKLELHMKSQLAIFALTMVMVVVFEIGVRVMGGFNTFLEHSSVNHTFFIIYLILHVLIALTSVVGWVAMLIKSYSAYKEDGVNSPFFKTHKKYAKLLFIGLTVTAYSGAGIYFMLFTDIAN